MTLLTGSLIEILFTAGIVFILTIITIILSPFGIGFIIFSLLRYFGKNNKLKKISFIFQIAITTLTFISGLMTAGILLIANSHYFYGNHFYIIISIILGTIFTVLIQTGIIIIQEKIK